MLGPTSHLAGAAAEQLQSLPVPRDERLLFGTRPALELSFTGQSFFPTLELLDKHKADRSPLAGVAAESASIVIGDSFVEVIGMADIVGRIAATDDVNIEWHASSSFAQDNRRSITR